MDQESILRIINSTLPVLASSPVLVKLVSSIENIVKTLYMPTLTLRNGKAEVDVEIYRRDKLGEYLDNQKFTLYEMTKLKNFLSASSFAVKELDGNNNGEEEFIADDNIDFDWVMRFFDAVGNISNENLQKLWGKIFAGEIKKSGSCSLRTLDIIRNMTPKEAQSYAKLCEYVLISGEMPFILGNGFRDLEKHNEHSREYIADKGLSFYEDVLPMVECGLLMDSADLATDFRTNNIVEIHNKTNMYCIIADKEKKNFMNVSAYFLTRSGTELYNIISNSEDFKTDPAYAGICMDEFAEEYPELKFASTEFH